MFFFFSHCLIDLGGQSLIIQLTSIKQMNFFYPFCHPLEQMCQNLYSVVSHQQSQLQPITILISNTTSCSDSPIKNDLDNSQTHTSIFEHNNIPQVRTEVKIVKKQIKKQNRRKQDQNFGNRSQNKDRKVLSGILKGYIHFTLNSPKVRKIVENLSKKMDLEHGVKIFYRFIVETFPHSKSYVGIKQMKKFLRGEGIDEDLSRLLATSLKYYLSEVFPLQLCLGGKQTKKAKISLFKKIRKLRSTLFQS